MTNETRRSRGEGRDPDPVPAGPSTGAANTLQEQAEKRHIAESGRLPEGKPVTRIMTGTEEVQAPGAPPIPGPVALADPEEPPVPGAFFQVGTTAIIGERDFLASSHGLMVASYTFDKTAVSADANGDKIVQEGTVLSFTAGGKAKAKASGEAAIGILRRRINVRDSDKEIGMVVGGAVNRTKLWDEGVFGATTGSTETDLKHVLFSDYDI